MKEGNTTAMLEQLRLREVALNSIFAKTGQKIRVKAVKVHKNNNLLNVEPGAHVPLACSFEGRGGIALFLARSGRVPLLVWRAVWAK